jgi:hypothetical protein
LEVFLEQVEQYQKPNIKGCIIPWTQLHGDLAGDYMVCCHVGSYNNPTILGTYKDKPSDVWNSYELRKIRKDFYAGKIPDECASICYKKEQSGDRSHRMNVNQKYLSYYKLQELTKSDGSVPYSPFYLDIRFGNLCNFRCRMCGPSASTSWYSESDGYSKILDKFTDNEIFWEDLPNIDKNIMDVYFAGGEPFIQDGHYKLLQYLIDRGLSKKISLSYNTNLSYIKYKKYDLKQLWSNFKKVMLWPSVEGFGTKLEYSRKGISWSQFSSNCAYFSEYIQTISSVISVYSITSMPELILWCKKNGFSYYGTSLLHPSYMSVTVFDKYTKKYINNLYYEFIKTNINILDNQDISFIKNWLSFMNSSDDSHLAPKFKNFNDKIDKSRSESFNEVFPELSLWYNSI